MVTNFKFNCWDQEIAKQCIPTIAMHTYHCDAYLPLQCIPTIAMHTYHCNAYLPLQCARDNCLCTRFTSFSVGRLVVNGIERSLLSLRLNGASKSDVLPNTMLLLKLLARTKMAPQSARSCDHEARSS